MENEKKKNKILCPVCKEMEDEDLVVLCKTAYDYVIETIKRDHPEWQEKDGACPKCVEYYKNL
jgi:hypothetical protein